MSEMPQALAYERVKIDSLKFDPRNARKHDDRNIKAIMDSLSKFGQQKAIVVGEGGVVIAGNGTLEAAKRLGWDTIDVRRSGLKADEATAYAIADNRSAELAEWDDPVLGDILGELKESGWELDDLGFNDDDLKDILKQEPVPGLTDEDEVPEVDQNEFGVKRGDIWQLGNHRLMCGDSTLKEDVEKLMNGEKADMVFTDPPYGMNLDTDYSKMPKGENKFKKVLNDDKDYNVKHIFEFFDVKNYFIWGADWFYESLPPKFSPIVWDKQPQHCEAGPQNHFELCWVYPKQKRRIIRKLWTGFTAKEKNQKRVHPTQKPVDLCIEIMGKNGFLVIDLFLGSGSTLIACEKTGRKCYGMELDEHYCSVIIKRWQDFTGKVAERIVEGA